MAIENWMAWEGGVDLVGFTQPGAETPNVIMHVARMVHTPVGSAPSGMIFWQPDASAPPLLAGFVSENPEVGAYFGPHIFAGTPFENAPALDAKIEIWTELPHGVGARVTVGDMIFESHMSEIGDMEQVNRAAGFMPFTQQGVEAGAERATLRLNGEEIALTLPEETMTGAAAACWSPCGIYAR